MLQEICFILAFAAFVATRVSGQASLPGTLSAEDRELVRLVLGSSLKARVGWSAELTVLLDSTRPLCERSAVRDCVSPIDDLTLSRVTSLMPECARVDSEALRDAFVDRNVGTWRLGELQTELVTVSGHEVRAMSSKALVERFPGRGFVEVAAPGYSSDGRFALVYVHGFHALPGGWATIQLFERRGAVWTPIGCGLTITA